MRRLRMGRIRTLGATVPPVLEEVWQDHKDMVGQAALMKVFRGSHL